MKFAMIDVFLYTEDMKKVILTIIIIIIVAGSVFFLRKTKEEKMNFIQNIVSSISKKVYYPDTSNVPILELVWSGNLDPESVVRIGPYGEWEGQFVYPEGVAYEPANEMQFYVATDVSDYLAVAPGIVTQKNMSNGNSGLVSVQYGRKYVVTYMHIFPRDDLRVGDKIEIVDILGKMEKRTHHLNDEETWWEIMLTVDNDGVYRTLPPYEYFSNDSKKLLDSILETKRSDNYLSWTIRTGCSWIKYVEGDSWWDSGRFQGLIGKESEQEFLDSLDLGWRKSEKGRVIGPVDDCSNR
mgnify:CR=1 FL=1